MSDDRSGISEATATYNATRAALARAPTAGNWREVLASYRDAAADLVDGPSLAQLLAWDESAFEAERRAMRDEWIRLGTIYNSISELEDSDEVGPGWADLALRSIQRVALSQAAWQAGRQHMVDALAQIAPDLAQSAQELAGSVQDFWKQYGSLVALGAGLALVAIGGFYVLPYLPKRAQAR
jgi:hypothetical protein